MSSSSFDVIRKHGSQATNVRIKELTQQLAKQQSDIASSSLETDDVRSEGRMDHSTIKLNDESLKFATTLDSANTDFFYEFPTEPDFSFLKVWFMLDHLGFRMRDMSGFGNDAIISGHPTLRRIGLDLGFQQTTPNLAATPVMLFNSGTDVVSKRNGEYIWIEDNPSIQFTQFAASGFSIGFRFRCLNFNPHIPDEYPELSFARRFAGKTDDASNGWSLIVYPLSTDGTTGGIEFEIKHSGINYACSTNLTLNSSSFYQVVVTYDPNAGSTSTQRIKIYVGGVLHTQSSTYGTILPTYSNLRIGARDSETGFFNGLLHDFRLYMGKVLTQTEVTNINTNELTIDNIPKGHVFVVQYALVSQSMRSTIHKFSTGGEVRRERIHKYNIGVKVTGTKTHKYNISIVAPTSTKTHKYNIQTKVQNVRTHKYNMGGIVRLNRTHKYNMGGVVRLTKTHPYNITGLQQIMTTQYIRFTKSTGANGVTQDVTFNDTPQAIIVWSDGTTSNNTFNENYHLYYGFSDGTHHACVSGYGQDAVSTSNAFSGHKSDKVISMMNTSLGTVSAEASVAFSASKATFTWSTNDARAVYVHCMAIWGLTAAEVKTFTTGTTSTGNATYTLNNSSLAPKCIHTIHRGGPVSWDTAYGNAISIGAASSPSKQWSTGNIVRDALSLSSNYYNWSYSDTTNVLVTLDDDSLAVEATAELYSMSTPGQFTLNWTDAPTASTVAFSVLCLDGNNVDVGTFAEPTATGIQNVTVSSTIDTVKGLMMFTTDITSSGGGYNAYMSVGGASGTGATEQGAVSVGDKDSSSTTLTARINRTGSIIRMISPTATATSSTTPAEASITALATVADQFTLNWSARNSTRRNHYIVFGQTISEETTQVSTTTTHKYNMGGIVSTTTTHKYNMGGTVSITKTHKYNIVVTQEYTEVYNVSTGVSSINLYSGASYTRAGIVITSTSSPMYLQVPKRVTVSLLKTANPTGTIYVRIRKGSDDSIGGEFGSMNSADVSTALTDYTFTNDNQSYAMTNGDRISVEFDGGGSFDFIAAVRTTTDVITDHSLTRYLTSSSQWTNSSTYDFRAIVYI